MSEETTYWEDVQAMAKDILVRLEEGEFEEDDIWDTIHEEVDSSAWIIYTQNNEDVLNQTDNYPDERDVACLLDPEMAADWQYVRMICAYEAMRGDLYEEVKRLQDEKEDEDE